MTTPFVAGAGLTVRPDIAVVEAAQRLEGAVAEPLAVLGGQKGPGAAVKAWADSQILVLVDHPVIRQPDVEPVRVRIAEARHQKAAGAFDTGLGLRQIGRIEDRPAI